MEFLPVDRAVAFGELALDPKRQDLVAACNTKLEHLISAEIGDNCHTWVVERPNLGNWPTRHGDAAA